MSKNYSGFFIKILGKQREFFDEYLDNEWPYTDIISDAAMDINPIELALVAASDDSITHLCLLRKTRFRVAVRKWKVDFTNIIQIDVPISLADIAANLSLSQQHHFAQTIKEQSARITTRTWAGILEYFKNSYPNSFQHILDLNKLRLIREHKYANKGADIYAKEKDAINLVLRFAGMEKETSTLKEWIPPDDNRAPFLKGITKGGLREDPMIIHDSLKFGDWVPGEHDHIGTITFENESDRVTIWNVNRQLIEETLGVDLLYYNHRFNSYVMVQYKRLELEEDEKDDGDISEDEYDAPEPYSKEWLYRPTDSSYIKELERMHQFENVAASEDMNILNDYRFNSQMFYFKLCHAESVDLNSNEMIKGMYLPLDYWDRLLTSADSTGPRGGKYVSYKNCGRRFNNSLFIDLVQSGWIGSRSITSDQITEIIKEILSSGKSLVLAKLEKKIKLDYE